jgi:hypothetical protein
LLGLTAALTSGVAHAAESSRGLTNLERVAVRVDVSTDVTALAADLERRIRDAVRQAPRPAPQVDSSSSDILRLTVGIQALSSRELRGFYLPFSRTYAVGPLRLAVLRRVRVGEMPGVIATVWENERHVAGAWRGVAADAQRLTDEVVNGFLAAYREAVQ